MGYYRCRNRCYLSSGETGVILKIVIFVLISKGVKMIKKTVVGFERSSNGLPVACYHSFDVSGDKQLLHYINDTLRATVPPEGWEEYCKQYPEAQDVVDQLIIRPVSDKLTDQAFPSLALPD